MFLYFAEATILSLCCKDKYFFLVLQRQLIFIGGNCFLSDPRSIISYPCHKQAHSLPHCCIVDLMDVSLACEDSNSKLVKVVTVAVVDAEKCVDDSLVQIWKLKLGHGDKFLLSSGPVNNPYTRRNTIPASKSNPIQTFGQDFEAEV